MVTFLRRDSSRFSKFGKKRKKMQKWRKPTGRDNKMRERIKGHPAVVSLGYKKDKKVRGKLEEKNPVIIKNLKELAKIKPTETIIVGKIGKKKMIEIVKKANEKKIKLFNINVKTFLKNLLKKSTPKGVPSKDGKKEEPKKEKIKKDSKDKKSEKTPKGVPSEEGKK